MATYTITNLTSNKINIIYRDRDNEPLQEVSINPYALNVVISNDSENFKENLQRFIESKELYVAGEEKALKDNVSAKDLKATQNIDKVDSKRNKDMIKNTIADLNEKLENERLENVDKQVQNETIAIAANISNDDETKLEIKPVKRNKKK